MTWCFIMGDLSAFEVSSWLGKFKSHNFKSMQATSTIKKKTLITYWWQTKFTEDYVCDNTIILLWYHIRQCCSILCMQGYSKYRYLFLLLLMLLSVYHTAWSLPKNYSAKKNLSQFSNSSKSLTNNGSTNLRQRPFSYHNECMGWKIV